MTKVAIVIHRNPTTIELYLPRYQGLKSFLLAGQGIVEGESHGLGDDEWNQEINRLQM